MDPLRAVLGNISQSFHVLVSLNAKTEFNQANCQSLVDHLKLLKPMFEDVGDLKTAVTGPVIRGFEELDLALNKAKDLIERCGPNNSKIYRVLRSQQFIAKFQNVSFEICQALSTLPLSSVHIPDQTDIQIERCIEELQQVRYTCEFSDERTIEEIENALRDHREGLKISCDKLKRFADRFNLISNQEVLREASALEKEKDHVRIEKDKQEEECINQLIGLVTQMCDLLVEVKQSQTEGGVPIPADFRCPLSLELMSDPVIVASGQTYERAYIQQWLDQGMNTCPKTRQTLSHTNLIPNYTVKALIANWCESNNVSLPEPAKLATCTQPKCQASQLGSTKAQSDDDTPSCLSGQANADGNLASFPASQSICGRLSTSSEDHGSEKENIGFSSGASEDQGNSSTKGGPSTDIEHQILLKKEKVNGNHVKDQPQGHSRNASVSSVTSSLDDGQMTTVGDGNVPEVTRASSDCSQYSSDVSGELPRGPQHRDMESPPRLPERSGSGGLNLWRRRPEERNSMPRIISSSVSNTRADGSGIQQQVEKLVEDLQSNSIEMQRAAAAELRLLAKFNMENRITIANCGAIRPLVALLHCSELKTQENAVTALLNLSINDNNKNEIAAAGAIDPLIYVLKTGNPEARENAAATLFSLSVMEENKIIIGQSGAIPPLVDLLRNGTPRGKKDAATALFNLSIYHENKARIVRAGAIKSLVELMDPAAGMVDKAVAVLANLATIPEGRFAIGEEGGIPALVEVVELGSQRGKENATAALLQLCTNSNRFRAMVLQEGAIPPLVALSQSGTPRAKEKAQALLRHFRDQRHAVLGRGGPDRQMDRHFDRP
eukprot:Gb_38670 [translate_table: standard]